MDKFTFRKLKKKEAYLLSDSNTIYNAESIQQLSFREGCRKRVGVYLGSADNEGVINGLLELVNNATDEAIIGAGDRIEIEVSDKWASCRDYGRGIPVGKSHISDEVLITLLTENHSGGKFDESVYKRSRGLNGTGSGATCVSSDWFEVTSKRDGAEWFLRFENGIPCAPTAKKIRDTKETGTFVKFQPSQEVFNAEEIHFNFKKICEIIEEYSYFNVGVTFIVTNVDTKEVKKFCSKNGLVDFADRQILKSLHRTPIKYSFSEDGIDIEIIAKWTQGKEQYFLFTNGASNPEGGTPITGAKTSITRTINNLAGTKFDGDTIRKGFVYVISIKHPKPIFANQIKSKVSNPELRGMCDKAFSEALKEFKRRSPDEFEKIIQLLIKEEKAEIAAEKARKQVLEAVRDVEKNQKKKVFSSDKLKDAEFLGQNSVLLVVEGNSAAASMSMARDIKKYGILAIRGKMLNCLSHPEEKIYQNEEIKLLLSAMNITPGRYDPKKLRYGKIAICVDSDSDGRHIALLILSALRYLAPQFLNENRLCWLRSPLYIVKNGKTETYYFSDEEYNKVKGKIRGDVSRAKGLGALSADQARASMFTEEFQRMDILEPNEESLILLEKLMGPDVEPRKNFVFNEIDFTEIKE